MAQFARLNPVQSDLHPRRAIIIGAGPAGLTAAYEFLARTDIVPVVLEKSAHIGGIASTHNYKGNRIDLGGHRFFSKSDRVMQWWLERLPLEQSASGQFVLRYQGAQRRMPGQPQGPDPDIEDRVMLLRKRRSRIYFLRRFFAYPIRFNAETLVNLGPARVLRIALSYMKAAIFPPRRVENLEQFFISRFGRELYQTFFKSYTEKVWGVPCTQISAAWGAQRIKGLSIGRTVVHFLKSFRRKKDIAQKDRETSLIEQFLYPKYGPGQMWEEVARQISERGGEILMEHDVVRIATVGGRVLSVTARDSAGEEKVLAGDYFFSSMPIQELVRALGAPVPQDVREISEGLVYRAFICVGLLMKNLKAQHLCDNWIYIQEPDVLAGRLQIFNNWSPYLVADASRVWIGVEYFCNEGDELWRRPDRDMAELASAELHKIGLIDKADVLDSTVLHMPKTYPAYFGTYSRFDRLREYLDGFENLYLVGRNGMHKYNNQDHSMLTAMTAVDNIAGGRRDKANIWEVNTELEYLESK